MTEPAPIYKANTTTTVYINVQIHDIRKQITALSADYDELCRQLQEALRKAE